MATITFAISGCAGSDVTQLSGGEQTEGWRVEEENGNPIDVFYMKVSGRASERAIEKGDEMMMKATCIESTTLQALDTLIRRMIGEEIDAASGSMDAQSVGLAISSMRKGVIRGTAIKECAPTGQDKSYLNCECVHFVKGRNLKKDFQLEIRKLQ